MEPRQQDSVDFSKLKLEVDDFLGIILPGLLAICEGWILLKGWHAFIATLNQISGTGLTLLVVLAFGLGHIVQELGDLAIKAVKGKRYFRQARDKFWETPEAQIVKAAIKKDFGQDISSVDTAFDYCLTNRRTALVDAMFCGNVGLVPFFCCSVRASADPCNSSRFLRYPPH